MNSRKFSLLPFLFSLFFGLNIARSQDLTPDQFNEVMDHYVGIWQGEYRIFSQDDQLLNHFKVNRNYWWDGAVLQGRVSYDFGEDSQTYFHRIILSNGVPFSFVTDSANSEEIRSALKGEYMKGAIVWNRVLPKSTLPVRISERIINNPDGRFIEFWGDQEVKDGNGRPFLVRIEGFAAYVPDSRQFVVTRETPDSPTASNLDREEMSRPDNIPAEHQGEEALQSDSISGPAPITVKPDPIPEPVLETRKPTPEPQPQPPVIEEDPEIAEAVSRLNVVGINDSDDETCIVVDYFLLYHIGDVVEMEKHCVFAGLDDQYLYFEDKNGFNYRLLRRDNKS